MSELPKGWVVTKFTDYLDVNGGTQPPKNHFLFEEADGYIRLLQIRDFGKKPVPTYVPFTKKLRLCSEKDILIGRYGASLGRICTGMEGCYNVALAKVAIPELIDHRFVKYYLESELFQQPLRLLSRSAQNGFNKQDLGNFNFPLAPFAEQKRIVAKLDEVLAQVDTIKARLDRIPAILKRFRQSVLAAAVSGKLTEEWRRRCAEVTLWKQITLKEAAHIQDPHPSHRTPPVVEGGIPFVSIGDLREDGSIDIDNARKVSTEVLKEHKARYTLKEGDFIFGKIGTLGKATVLPIGIDFALSANVILIQPETNLVEPKYIQYFLSSPTTMDEVAKQANSTSQAAFGIRKMREFICNLPTKSEQTEIVRLVDQYFAFADTIEAQVKKAQARVDNLTQSILAKAFRGELVAQDLNDEPADKLLERIAQARTEAEQLAKASKRVKTRA